MMKRYEIWLTLELWEGDDKISDFESCKVMEDKDEDNIGSAFIELQDTVLKEAENL